jgi:cell division protein FtsZ
MNRKNRGHDRHDANADALDLLEIGPDDGDDLLEFEDRSHNQAVIKVIGVGGGGGNAVATMLRSGLAGVEFVAANTDAQALAHNPAGIKLQLGTQVTRGLGCGADPERGRASALEDRERLRELIGDADMVFVTAGMGGGTGTGAAPIVAEVAREMGALTVAVVTKPFMFEGRVRSRQAERGIEELHRTVDTLITIPNNRLLALAGKNVPMRDAFRLADDVLLNAVRGISDLITTHGLINLDFADVRTIMNEMGMALMGTGTGRGDNRAVDAARAAISSPLLEDLSMEGARGVLINVTGGEDMTLFEVNEASTLVQDAAHEDANIIFGAVIDPTMGAGEIRVTVIATGLDGGQPGRARDRVERAEPLAAVRPLRAEPRLEPRSEPAASASRSVPPLERSRPAPPPPPARSAQPVQADWVSPFEDELDEPAFLRRQHEGSDDHEIPTFLRRQAD